MDHLIHVGYAKAGSSVLQRWFAEHPQIGFARDGLAGFRTVYDVSRIGAVPLGELRLRVTSEESLVMPRVTAGSRPADYAGEGVPAPSGAGRVCGELVQLFPTATVLLVTRGFRGRMLSAYSQGVRMGVTYPFFVLDPAFGIDHRSTWLWDYNAIIDLYARAFPGRLIVLPFELLRDDPDRFVRILEARFGLDHHPLPRAVENPALSGEELLWYPRMTRALLRLRLPGKVKRRIVGLHLALIARGWTRPLVRLLQTCRPGEPVGAHMVTDTVLENFRGQADRLRDDPLYAPYAADYLF